MRRHWTKFRKAAEGDAKVAGKIDAGLLELGVSGILVPEEHDGLGLGLVEAVLMQEAMGGAVSPGAFLARSLAVIGIEAAATEDQKAEYLPRIASGEFRFGVAINERVGARDGAGVKVEEGKLNGTTIFALETDGASHLLVPAPDGQLLVVDADASGLKTADMHTIDRSRGFTEITFDGVSAVPLSAENEPGLALRTK